MGEIKKKSIREKYEAGKLSFPSKDILANESCVDIMSYDALAFLFSHPFLYFIKDLSCGQNRIGMNINAREKDLAENRCNRCVVFMLRRSRESFFPSS